MNQSTLFPVGTQVVTLRAIMSDARVLHPQGAVGMIVAAPTADDLNYRVRFVDGLETSLSSGDLTLLSQYQQRSIGSGTTNGRHSNLFQYVIYQCVIGSRAYGLDDEDSDIDRRGFFVPPAELHWSLYGIPQQLECDETQEAYWELQKFITLALKSNPSVLECLYSPLVEKVTPLAQELLDMRASFLSKLVYQTFNGYVASQFKKMQAAMRHRGEVKWKHVMHLIRLLITGIRVLQEGHVQVRVESQRESLLAIKRGEWSWTETEKWRKTLHKEFDAAFAGSKLPDQPDYERANQFLIHARRQNALNE